MIDKELALQHGSLAAFAEQCLRASFQTCHGQLEGSHRGKVTDFMILTCTNLMMTMTFTTEGSRKIVDYVFGDEVVRNFVLRLTSVFLCRFGHDATKMKELIDTVANSMSMVESEDTSLIPLEVRARMPSKSDIQELLAGNKWLLVIVLCHMYLQFEIKTRP